MAENQGVRIVRAADLPFRAAQGDGAAGLSLARLYQHPERALTFQLARIEPGGISRRHSHPWEQINFVASGTGQVEAGAGTFDLQAGDCVIFAPDQEHQISNTGSEPLLLVGVLGPGAS